MIFQICYNLNCSQFDLNIGVLRMIIQHNMAAINTMHQLGITNTNLRKSTERLSSGYRVNRAADDAAKLTISEKKRSQVRGLLRAAQNAEDGISFVQTGDGAMSQMADVLQRMRELTIQSLNDVNTDEDRACIQMEFDELQKQIDQINEDTEFNTNNVFERYADTYSSFKGNHVWSQDKLHKIDASNNSLTVHYKIAEEDAEKTLTLTIPAGTYTTQQLMDEMDDVVTAMGESADGLYLEYTEENCCNMVLQNGEEIQNVTGGLSYLFYDQFQGSEVGSLIGTTIFSPNFPLQVNSNNNELKFTIENFDGSTKDVDITIDSGYYSRNDMINYLNQKLTGTGMKASEYGEYCIQIGGEDGIITGLKGNMFKIDDPNTEQVMSSVFYDNTKYGKVVKDPAVFTGGTVLVSNSSDTQHNKYHIDDTNNTLKIRTNGAKEYTDIVLDSGDYTVIEMKNALQTKLNEAGIHVTVSTHESDNLTTVNGNRYFFSGLILTSKKEGMDSAIQFDVAGSSAYDTLFVEREYVDVGKSPTATNGSFSYTRAKLTGGKTFATSDFPLTLDSSNHSFQIAVKESTVSETGAVSSSTDTYTINLAEKTYNSVDEIIGEINNQLNGASAPAGLKNKLQAVKTTSNAIQLTAADGNVTVIDIDFQGDGYKTLFQEVETVYSYNAVSSTGTKPSIKLDKLTFPMTFDENNNKLTVNVGGEDRNIVIPPGTYTEADKDVLAEKITEQLKGGTSTYVNAFSGYGEGTTTNKNAPYSKTGSDNRTQVKCNVKGSGSTLQGTTEIEEGKPATYTVPVTLKSNTTITSANNQFAITINQKEYNITLASGDYTPQQLAQEFQNKLDGVITSETAKVNVTLTNNRLTFTTASSGQGMSLAFSAATSTFIESISTNKTAATTTTMALQETITIDNTSNSFAITVDGKRHVVNLASQTYTRESFINELNRQFTANNVGVKASLTSGSVLTFTTTEAKGTDSSIYFNTSDCGTSSTAMFGQLVTNTPATATLKTPLKETISIENGSNEFKVRVVENGSTADLKATIPAKDYTRDELVNVLNTSFAGKVNVSINASGCLSFTTVAKGSGVSVTVNNSISGSAAKAMFGTYTVKKPDVVASIDGDGNLILTGDGSTTTYKLSATPVMGSGLLSPTSSQKTTNPTSTAGKVAIKYYSYKGNKAVPTNIKIDANNKDLHFIYNKPNGETIVDFQVDEKTYTRAELQTALQEKIDGVLGSGELKVNVSSSGITFTALKYGSSYSMENVTGGFYDGIIKGTAVRSSDETTSYKAGAQRLTDTYIIGRKDVKNTVTQIQEGVSDELSMDVTIGNTVYTLNMKLKPGEYEPDELIKMIQKKVDEQVKAKGLPEKSILVGIGKFDSGVEGADDKNALDFYLNSNVDLLEGTYKIDGLKGSSLFEIFYKTTGDLIPAYITGTKDISGGVEIVAGENTLSLDVDGDTYEYTIPEGEYTKDELLEVLNELFDNPDNNGNTAQVSAQMSGESLKFSHNKIGKHSVENVQGSVKNTIFQEVESRTDYDSTLMVQIGANTEQATELTRYSMSTVNMGINSVNVTTRKYANKALTRLDEAIDYLNSARASYGAKQNRLEYTVKGNENTAENLQASESRDRDTDMAEEMVQYSKAQILQQAGTAMLTQATQHGEAILRLLQM